MQWQKSLALAMLGLGAVLFVIGYVAGSHQSGDDQGWVQVNAALEETIAQMRDEQQKQQVLNEQLILGLQQHSEGDSAAQQPQPPVEPPVAALPEQSASPSPVIPADSEPLVTKQQQEQTATRGLLDLNLATLAQLEQLPGIGPSKAKAIADYRTKLGGFRRIDELLEVKGIGSKLYERIRAYVSVVNDTSH